MLRPEIIFTDYMVLQQNKKIRVFGEASDNTQISVTIKKADGDVSAKANSLNGRFEVELPKLKATKLNEEVSMEITDGIDTVIFNHIAIGEVFLAGGQSNMELELQNAEGGRDILDEPLSDNDIRSCLRYFYTPKVAYKDDEYESKMREGNWKKYSKENAANWSAVGYFFALNLAKKLNVPVGIIGCNWGGTLASCWMSREVLLTKFSTKNYVLEYENSTNFKKSFEEQKADYDYYLKYQEAWDMRAAQLYEKEPMMPFDRVQIAIGKCEYPGPVNCVNYVRPYGLYETMLKRIAPYTLGGVIYYQGESDENNPDAYYDLQTLLIMNWREDFKDPTLPFIMTQLPMHRYNHDADTRSWCKIREAQMRVYNDLKNTGIAVIIDCGKFHEIHPPRKNEVGERLANQALLHIYHLVKEDDVFGPIYRDYEILDGAIRIIFDYMEDGVDIRSDEIEFEVADETGSYKKATAKFMNNTVTLTSDEVAQPVRARYLWKNYTEVNVFGKNGMPMAPFRTHKD